MLIIEVVLQLSIAQLIAFLVFPIVFSLALYGIVSEVSEDIEVPEGERMRARPQVPL